MREGLIKKSCPKCEGNVFLYSDLYGWYEQCLQCSHTEYLETLANVQEKVSKDGLEQAEILRKM
jgi:hypothetical protein